MLITDIIHWGAEAVRGSSNIIASTLGIDVAAVNADLATLNALVPPQSGGTTSTTGAQASGPGTGAAQAARIAAKPAAGGFDLGVFWEQYKGYILAGGALLFIGGIALILIVMGGPEE